MTLRNACGLWLVGVGLALAGGMVAGAEEAGGGATKPATREGGGEAEVSASVNGVRDAVVPKGWPVIVEGVYSLGANKELGVKLKVTDSPGKGVDLPFEKLAGTAADAAGFVTAYWVLSPDQTKVVGAGQVQVEVELTEKDEVVGSSAPASIKWVEAAAEVPEAEYPRYMALLVRYDLLRGKKEEASAKIAGWRIKRPGDPAPTMLAGDLHFEAGRLKEAAEAYNMAMKQWAASRPKGAMVEPPTELLARQRAVMAAMAKNATKTIANSPDAQGK